MYKKTEIVLTHPTSVIPYARAAAPEGLSTSFPMPLPETQTFVRRRRRHAALMVLPSDLLIWHIRYTEHLTLKGVPLSSIRRRVAWSKEFLNFLTDRRLYIEDSDNNVLPRKYLRSMEAEVPFNRKRAEYRYREACKFINFVTGYVQDGPTAPTTPEKPKSKFKINERGPRTEAILKKTLDYDAYVFPSEQAKLAFDSLFRTLVEHLLEYRTTAGSWNSFRGAEQDLKTFLKFIAESNSWMPATAFTKQTVLQYRQWLEDRGLAESTICRNLTSLRRVLYDVPGMDPSVYRVEGPTIPRPVARPMDFTDALELLCQFDPTRSDKELRYRIIMELLLGCGLRISEVLNITPSFVYREKATKLVRIIIPQTKVKRALVIEIPPRTVPLLDELERRNKLAGQNDVYFVQKTTHTQKLTYEYFRKDFKRALIRAGLESKTKIHALRATFATVLLARGVPREKVSDLLNHSNPASIMPYDAFTGSDREGLVRQYHPLFQVDPGAPSSDGPPANIEHLINESRNRPYWRNRHV